MSPYRTASEIDHETKPRISTLTKYIVPIPFLFALWFGACRSPGTDPGYAELSGPNKDTRAAIEGFSIASLLLLGFGIARHVLAGK